MPEDLTRRRALGAAGAGALISTVVLPPASAAASPAAPAATAPGAPTQVEVAEGAATAVLSWTAGAGATDSTTYTVEHRARDSTDTWTAFASSAVILAGTTATATLPSSGSQLEYRVSATEGGLTSAPSVAARPVASGGDAVVLHDGDAVHTFTTVGAATLTLHADRALEALVVGGGGGGGGSPTADNAFVAGGGGAGGFLELTGGTAVACVAGSADITVGDGGAATEAGDPSTLVLPIEGGTTTRTATGGGGGRHVEDGSATVSSGAGASGGGGVATADVNVGEAGDPPATARNGGPATASDVGPLYGNVGGAGMSDDTYTAGGGGGAGGAGDSGASGGAGGAGRASSMSGVSRDYAAGGGGGASSGSGGLGGSGIGGAGGITGGAGGSGRANTGSGGGGARKNPGGAGGSGIVIVRVPLVAAT